MRLTWHYEYQNVQAVRNERKVDPIRPDHKNPTRFKEDQRQLVFAHSDKQKIEKWLNICKAAYNFNPYRLEVRQGLR